MRVVVLLPICSQLEKNMKLFYISIIALLLSSCSVAQTKVTKQSFPTNFTNLDFKDLDVRNGNIIAFDGKIVQVKNSRNNTPFYLLELNEGKKIWTVLLFKHRSNILIGDKIRVVGYLSKIEDRRPEEDYLIKEKYMVMGMGLVQFKKEIFLFLDGADIQRKEWIDGQIPTQG